MDNTDRDILQVVLEQCDRFDPSMRISATSSAPLARKRHILRMLKDGTLQLVDSRQGEVPASDEAERRSPTGVDERDFADTEVGLRVQLDAVKRERDALVDTLESIGSQPAVRAITREEALDELVEFVLSAAQWGAIRAALSPEGSQSELRSRAEALICDGEPGIVAKMDKCNAILNDAITLEELLNSVWSRIDEAYKRTGKIEPRNTRNKRRSPEGEGGREQVTKQADEALHSESVESDPFAVAGSVSPADLEGIIEQRRHELHEQLRLNREQLTKKLLEYLPTVEGRSFATVEESRAFVSELNLMLENAGQRLVDPDSGRTGVLYVTPATGEPKGGYFRFRLDPEQPGARRRASSSYKLVPPLSLPVR